MEHQTFERAIPEGYREVYHIDAANKKTGLLLTLGSLLIAAGLIFFFFMSIDYVSIDLRNLLKYNLVFLAAMLAYVVLHELTHGAVYKALTKEKLRFGITWSAAFCGVPDIYTYRDTALKSLVAPLALFSVLLIPLLIWLHRIDAGWYLVTGVIFSLHISGCIGDLCMTALFLTKFKDPETLMRDTGPEQWIYGKE
ncbi:MAG: DUF3267 domain-containing protein [Oscillospiraceae bacterium]|nr:DUF3267 domain-containing protein [Oscillospiraceae bacterium]